ncbi:MAG: DNA-directed RNA polymerase subunit beta', partial [Desulfobacterales bacterium]|nr:DNA-directed RNA polymerase subunit beta' [Desulfobacterales bacterium]
SNNILSPANGSPIIVPSQDIVLGLYYMTRRRDNARGEGKIFADPGEVRCAYDSGAVDLHAGIVVRMGARRVETTVGRILLWEIIPQDYVMRMRRIMVREKDKAEKTLKKIRAGEPFTEMVRKVSQSPDKKIQGDLGLLNRDEFKRVFDIDEGAADAIFSLNEGEVSDVVLSNGECHLFEVTDKKTEVPFDEVNHVMDKGRLRGLVDFAYRNLGPKATVILADRLKDIGYAYSTEGGLSISIDAMIIPGKKWDILNGAESQVSEIGRQYTEGLITQGEKYNKVVDIWAKATDDVANEMMESMKMVPEMDENGAPVVDESGKMVVGESFNPIYMMADSGARGSKDQMRQLAGMRGLMAKPSGEIIETPISANFREGLSVLQYFISTHGARKGLADTALKTANSGYLTRRLADVSQDCIIAESDCGAMMGMEVEPLMEGGEVIQRLGERILGRVALNDILDPFTDKVLVEAGADIDEAEVAIIEDAGIGSVKIRSVLTCKSRYGVCARCYGRDLSHGRSVEIGQAIGILAAQSIGEPGTQLTMRTFHIGGTASRRVEQADIRARVGGKIRYDDLQVVRNADQRLVVMNRRGGEFTIVSETGRERERFPVIFGA